MSTWIGAFFAVAAIAATYFFCVRPMRRGSCAISGSATQHAHTQQQTQHTPTRHIPTQDTEIDRQLAELREELRVLRAQDPHAFTRITALVAPAG